MEISRVGVDLAKRVFQLHGTDRKGKAVWKRKLSRDNWISFTQTDARNVVIAPKIAPDTAFASGLGS